MKENLEVIILLIFFIIISSISIVSAEIIWSQPTEVPFTVSESQELAINIISPLNQTYRTRTIPIEVETNIPAQCSYSIDNQAFVNIGNSTHFSTSLRLSNGAHTLIVKCIADSQQKTAGVSFRINTPARQNNTELEQDLEYEQILNTPVYGQWHCINNILQRKVSLRNLESIEYGGICGVNQTGQEQISYPSSLAWIFPIIILILILLTLIAITIIAVKRELL